MGNVYKLWFGLVVLRFIWCIWPQTSYVDPAEFFEGTDKLASRIFGFPSTAAAGYDTPKPQTTIFFPYITAGAGFHLLRKLAELGLVAVNERTLLIAPRLMITAVSLLCDSCVYNIATILGQDAGACMVIFASSFATLVFMTRNMTHVISTCTFALLLLLVVDSRKSQLAPKTPSKDGKQKKKSKVVSDPNHGFWLGVFVLEGVFNHPSFFIYYLIPMAFWLTGSASQLGSGALRTVLYNLASLLPGIVTMGTFLLVLDSTFYGTLDAEILLNPQLLLENLNSGLVQNLTVAPLNFLRYNFLDAPLEIRPKTTHLLFNLPLLFFPLVISFISEIFMVYKGAEPQSGKTFSTSTSRAFFALVFTTPLLVFSLLPDQDPKLLLPLIIPLVLLYAEYVIYPATGMPNAPWIVWNVLFGLVFGAVLQGGVIPALGDIKATVTAPVVGKPTFYHYVFYHTPTPPQYLLALPPQGTSSKHQNQFLIHDLGEMDRFDMHQTIGSLLRDDKSSPEASSYKKEIYVIAPASIDALFCRINVKFTYKFVKRFTPHVSLNEPPYLFPDYVCSAEKDRSYFRMGIQDRIPALFSLNMYKVKLVRHVGSEDIEKYDDIQKQKSKGTNKNQ
ncbi:GPI mannosyltransferase 4 [Strongylocentrotus purpuratus]|uniref:Mannosyltransferase n=1 Tax=Strongylocentrotus purpuratus TaxID=7668 RepID=A0A7M7RCL4_STRPU|nr:GPI mannosyltransferase 4 [Strongylocentrotus purpuratus]XP_784333.4 GPI mannosyltransferase 4 [Strongylocentrotus purpuratus]|eukprot:XP_001178821.1 PREDICTED: GPI mannosyltransferase 4 [Strongylocentrotus purpuratus]